MLLTLLFSLSDPAMGEHSEFGESSFAAKTSVEQFDGLEFRAVRDLGHVDNATLGAIQKYGFAPKNKNDESIVLHHHKVKNGAIVNQITSWFDPSVEFLEIGLEIGAERYWKTFGLDMAGSQSVLQGIGGLEAIVQESNGEYVGILDDYFGHVVGYCLSSNSLLPEKHPTSVQSYGPVLHVNASEEPVLLENEVGSLLAVAKAHAWRGKRMDATGFYWLGARHYEPSSGRFLSPDPLGHAGSLDLYSYANGDPINYVDPDGRYGYQGGSVLRDFDNAITDTISHLIYNMPKAIESVADFALHSLPVISFATATVEMFTERNVVTGERIEPEQAFMNLAFGVIDLMPVVGMAAKSASIVGRGVMVEGLRAGGVLARTVERDMVGAAMRSAQQEIFGEGAMGLTRVEMGAGYKAYSSPYSGAFGSAVKGQMEKGIDYVAHAEARTMGREATVVINPTKVKVDYNAWGSGTYTNGGAANSAPARMPALPPGEAPYQLKLFPDEVYSRTGHYGNTPTAAQRASVPPGMEFDHNPTLVKHYYEGDAAGGLPGFNLTQTERLQHARSLSSGSAATPAQQRAQGAAAAAYSKQQKKANGL
jgi:RHS repeat-associated protein